ncbi:unnamed protein product [Lepeophtheirus salmonis]|uniref:(salmon louse) hypothetical protein n=1 Tax=Lepeophtheirus salmonis TaxID=72036 RepID=A0A7R8H5R4_LEPSM|nr:unnamed protein product [Lepeophtheirus salmonis]CAF2868203.1 unnamed protein product [Lepeophtheirus salmonis]
MVTNFNFPMSALVCVLRRWSSYSSSVRTCSTFATHKSPISLENLYPSKPSFLDRYSNSPPNLPPQADSSFSGWIPMDSLVWEYDTHTPRVSISFKPEDANDWLPKEACLTPGRDGFVTVTSNRTRSFLLNRADVLQKLRAVIRESISPETRTPILEEEREIQLQKSRKIARENLIVPIGQSSMILSSDDVHNINSF